MFSTRVRIFLHISVKTPSKLERVLNIKKTKINRYRLFSFSVRQRFQLIHIPLSENMQHRCNIFAIVQNDNIVSPSPMQKGLIKELYSIQEKQNVRALICLARGCFKSHNYDFISASLKPQIIKLGVNAFCNRQLVLSLVPVLEWPTHKYCQVTT